MSQNERRSTQVRRKNLKIFRIEHDMTQSDMAERIGCSRDAYSAIESGARDPSYGFMEALHIAFAVPSERMWALLEREN